MVRDWSGPDTMRQRLRYLLPLGIFLVIAAFLGVGLTLDSERVPSPLVGKPMPAFALPGVHEPERMIGPDDFRGQVWLLNVWATWCAACRVEHPVLLEAANRHGMTIVGLDYKDERGAAIDWLRDLGDPYVVSAYDPEGRVGLDLGVYGVPETYVVDRAGIIRYKHIGPVSREDLRERILPLLAELDAEG